MEFLEAEYFTVHFNKMPVEEEKFIVVMSTCTIGTNSEFLKTWKNKEI